MVTVFEVEPPIVITTGTALPGDTPVGTCTFTWYSPTKPGERPENAAVIGMPPMVTVGVATVLASGPPGPAAPLAGRLFTSPSPVQ